MNPHKQLVTLHRPLPTDIACLKSKTKETSGEHQQLRGTGQSRINPRRHFGGHVCLGKKKQIMNSG
jgi:hypothetical protein